MVAHCNICQVEPRSLLGGNTLTPVPPAGSKFCGGEHTVQGPACRPVTSSWASHVSTHQPFPKDDSSCA